MPKSTHRFQKDGASKLRHNERAGNRSSANADQSPSMHSAAQNNPVESNRNRVTEDDSQQSTSPDHTGSTPNQQTEPDGSQVDSPRTNSGANYYVGYNIESDDGHAGAERPVIDVAVHVSASADDRSPTSATGEERREKEQDKRQSQSDGSSFEQIAHNDAKGDRLQLSSHNGDSQSKSNNISQAEDLSRREDKTTVTNQVIEKAKSTNETVQANARSQSDGEEQQLFTEESEALGVSSIASPKSSTAALLLAELQRVESLPAVDSEGVISWTPDDQELQALEEMLGHLPVAYARQDRERILRAFLLASYAHRNQHRESGEPYVLHPIAVGAILADLRMDVDTLAAGLLHDVAEDTDFELGYIQDQFGATAANLVDGVTKLKRINELSNAQQGIADAKAESLRKMFLAMVDDVRVVLIKLADRLHNMRTLGSQKKHKQKRIARETLDIFAPLANRLGIWQIKWELEDLSFRHLDPATYRELARAMAQKRDDREKWISRIKRELEQELAKEGIAAEVTGRPKHIYSIYRKMKRKDVDFDQIYDIHGFRIIVDSEAHCYAALGVVHSKWRPIPGEFDDYIANPKDNMYRSLHTAVLGKRSGRPMEIQIRTREMHEIAERGIAAHWRYKEDREQDARFQQKIAWLRQLMEWRQEVTDAAEFVNSMKTDVFNDRVYVFTPQGDVIDLPAGSTPIDFAYSIHTELGHRCRGANIKGRLVPLDYKLQNGDQITIIAAKRGGPSRDWLNPNLEYVATQRARSKIRGWLRKQGRDENIQRGRQMLEKEMKRLSITDSFEAVARLFNYDKVDDFLAAIGYGDINSQHLAQRVLEKERSEQEQQRLFEWGDRSQDVEASRRTAGEGGFRVQGVDGLLTHLGKCCNPVPGDAIVGYVTRGRGVTIHRTSCPNVSNFVRKGQNSRLVDVQWAAKPETTFPVAIQVSAYDRSGLMRDVAALVADEHINMLSVEALTGQKDNLALINATLEIMDAAQLARILTKIDRLPNVVEARRKVS